MGFIFGKKKSSPAVVQAPDVQTKPSTPKTGALPARAHGTRQSRRVVAAPVAKPTMAKPAITSAASGGDQAIADPDDLALGLIPSAVPTRAAGTAPISASAPPVFTGTLNRETGPVRTGDQALGEFLVSEAKLISAEQAQAAQAKAKAEGITLDAALVASQVVSEDAILGALSQARYFPHLQLDRYAIRKKALDTVSREDAVRLSVMPVDKLGSLLQLAMVNPLDEETVALIHARTGLEVKRCIATRAELERGIEKWYGGLVQAQDSSISFVAEATQETKSLTQVLGNVSVASPTSASNSAASTTSVRLDISPEIQDIDDLLSADEVIAPAIIEPIHLDDAPLIVPADEVVEAGQVAVAPSALEPRHAAGSVAPDVSSDMPELALEEVPITKPVPRAKAAEKVFIQLIPVLEDEFKYAITHNKAHAFEKWVGLQTRNRIINAVPVEPQVEPLIALLSR